MRSSGPADSDRQHRSGAGGGGDVPAPASDLVTSVDLWLAPVKSHLSGLKVDGKAVTADQFRELAEVVTRARSAEDGFTAEIVGRLGQAQATLHAIRDAATDTFRDARQKSILGAVQLLHKNIQQILDEGFSFQSNTTLLDLVCRLGSVSDEIRDRLTDQLQQIEKDSEKYQERKEGGEDSQELIPLQREIENHIQTFAGELHAFAVSGKSSAGSMAEQCASVLSNALRKGVDLKKGEGVLGEDLKGELLTVYGDLSSLLQQTGPVKVPSGLAAPEVPNTEQILSETRELMDYISQIQNRIVTGGKEEYQEVNARLDQIVPNYRKIGNALSPSKADVANGIDKVGERFLALATRELGRAQKRTWEDGKKEESWEVHAEGAGPAEVTCKLSPETGQIDVSVSQNGGTITFVVDAEEGITPQKRLEEIQAVLEDLEYGDLISPASGGGRGTVNIEGEVWKGLRALSEKQIRELSNLHLEGANLVGADLTGARITDVTMHDVNLTAAVLRDAVFRGDWEIVECRLPSAHAHRAIFVDGGRKDRIKKCTGEGAFFDGADLGELVPEISGDVSWIGAKFACFEEAKRREEEEKKWSSDDSVFKKMKRLGRVPYHLFAPEEVTAHRVFQQLINIDTSKPERFGENAKYLYDEKYSGRKSRNLEPISQADAHGIFLEIGGQHLPPEQIAQIFGDEGQYLGGYRFQRRNGPRTQVLIISIPKNDEEDRYQLRHFGLDHDGRLFNPREGLTPEEDQGVADFFRKIESPCEVTGALAYATHWEYRREEGVPVGKKGLLDRVKRFNEGVG